MTERFAHPRVVVIHADGSVSSDSGTAVPGSERAHLSGQKSAQEYISANVCAPKCGDFPHESHAEILARGDAVKRLDPHQVHRDFPLLWKAYIRAHYSSLLHVQREFGVSESCARKWWNGKGGVNGGNVAVACRKHPETAPRMLFAAE